MRKTFYFWTGILILCNITMAQNGRIGIYGGANFSGINGNYSAYGYQTTEIKGINRMQMGLILSIPLSERFSLYMDPGYLEKGFKFNEEKDMVQGVAFSGSQRFNYINLPFTIKFGVTKNQFFYLRSGIYYSFLLSSQIKSNITYTYPEETIYESTDEKNTGKMNKSTLGIITAVGMDIPLSKMFNFFLDLSYNLDLTNPMKDNYPHYLGIKTITILTI